MGPPLVANVALPAEMTAALREVMADSRFSAYVKLVAPSPPSSYSGRVYVVHAHIPGKRAGGWPWICLRGRQGDMKRLLARHLLAGATHEPQRYASGVGAVFRAVGLSTPAQERVKYVSVDLDGQHGYEPHAVVAALRAHGGHDSVLVTSSSGRLGRYRALLLLGEPLPWAEMVSRASALLADVGFPAKAGGVEIFPCGRNSRLPFGLGGCSRFNDDALVEGRETHPLELSETLLGLRPLSLPVLTDRRRAASSRSTGTARPVSAPEDPSSSAARTSRVPLGDAGRRAPNPSVSHWWKSGVAGPGERDAALWALILDCRDQGLSRQQAVVRLQRWIDDGGLDRSRVGTSTKGREWQRRDVVRRVADAYRHPAKPRLRALHLTERETVDAAARAEETAATPHEAAGIFGLLLAVLPTFKAVAASGAPYIALSHEWWRKHGGERCALLRDASALFVRVGSHRAQREFGAHAHAARWQTTFPFDRASPDRAVLPARAPGQTSGYRLRQARLLVTGTVPRGLRARVSLWWMRTRSGALPPTTIADTVDETLWLLLRDSARAGDSNATLHAKLAEQISAHLPHANHRL